MGMQKIDMAIRSTMYVEDMDKLRHTLRGGHRPLEHGIAHFRHTPQNHRIVKEEVVQVLVDHAVHPVEQLTFTTLSESTILLRRALKDANDIPKLF